MSKITESHLSRDAYVYIRQSTQDQVNHNLESKRRQYSLQSKARELGWSRVVVIDEDLGKSASGSTERAGFERLLAKVCQGIAGAIFAVEASRLARNGREWHTLLEFCGFMETLIIDHDGVYDPRHPNDRLLLGMKGTISEMELTILRQRSLEALRQKALRGELYLTVAVGYILSSGDRLEKDPDLRVQNAIALVFRKFQEMASVRQVLLWFRQKQLRLPAVIYQNKEKQVFWKMPVYNTLLHILTNPIYAGAYAFGRTYTETRIENGQKRKVRGYRRKRQDWPVLIKDHHEAYIKWEEYLHNQHVIAENANMKGAMVRGSVKRGPSLLAGLLRCGHCGRKMHVMYSGAKGKVVRYGCRGAQINHGAGRCISIGAIRLERVITDTVLNVLSPLGIEAAIEAVHRIEETGSEEKHQKELALQQARYEAERARKQYDFSDPENRLIAAELERRWNEKLLVVQTLEDELQQMPVLEKLNPEEEKELINLGEDLRVVWEYPESDVKIKKRILRIALKEIVISISKGVVKAILHWAGGDHSEIQFPKNKTGMHRWRTDIETEHIIRSMARMASDHQIASLLNRLGNKTGKGNSWTKMRVTTFRNDRNIAVYREGEVEARGELFLNQAAERIGVHKSKIYKLIRKGLLPATQVCVGAPWIIREEDLSKCDMLQGDKMKGLKSPLTSTQPNLFTEKSTT
ncbi:MAG: recombinase family protein [Deltaproteobacteria bacterium]|nr:recombinase family protein [Deltaproteobacteria bacterium]